MSLEEVRVSGVASWARRGHQTMLGRLLIIALVIATLSPAARAPAVDAQDLTADDEAWIEQRIAEAGIYLGGGIDTATLSPEELPEFGDLYRDCLYIGLQ